MSSTNEILGGEEIEMHRFGFEPPEPSRGEALKRKWTGTVDYMRSINDRINHSTFGRVFRLKGSGHVSFSTLQSKELYRISSTRSFLLCSL